MGAITLLVLDARRRLPQGARLFLPWYEPGGADARSRAWAENVVWSQCFNSGTFFRVLEMHLGEVLVYRVVRQSFRGTTIVSSSVLLSLCTLRACMDALLFSLSRAEVSKVKFIVMCLFSLLGASYSLSLLLCASSMLFLR